MEQETSNGGMMRAWLVGEQKPPLENVWAVDAREAAIGFAAQRAKRDAALGLWPKSYAVCVETPDGDVRYQVPLRLTVDEQRVPYESERC